MNKLLLGLLIIVGHICLSSSLIHHLKIKNDHRMIYHIETFGFLPGGVLNLNVSDFNIQFTKAEKEEYGLKNDTSSSHTKNVTVPTVPAVPVTPATAVKPTPNAAAPAALSAPDAAAAAVPVAARRALAQTPKDLKDVAKDFTIKTGFVFRKYTSNSDAQNDLERVVEDHICLLDRHEKDDIVFDFSNYKKWKKLNELEITFTEENAGLYSLIFVRCQPTGYHSVSYNLDATFYNPGPNYLTAGETKLPTLYFLFGILFASMLLIWGYVLSRNPVTNGTVHKIHYLMCVLLVLKVLTLFADSVRYHYIATVGMSDIVEDWNYVYYFFETLKGIMLFVVILLIGSGYTLMKSYLNDKEKKIIFVVLILQVMDNIAMVIVEERAPGSLGFVTWQDILHLIDLVCCVAILLPVVWSIKHLRQAAEVDGKAHNSLMKLQLFRTFYITVVVYIYFSRIAVFLISATVPDHMQWLGEFSTEAAAFIFYVFTGYKFRPAIDNPYLPVRSEDLEGGDYGLEDEEDDDGVELAMSSK